MCVHSRAKNHLSLYSLRSGIFDETNRKKIEKNEKNVFLAETLKRHTS